MINRIFSRLVNPARKIVSSNKGQTAIVIIFTIAIALVMYSASLNWGRVAQYKALVTIGSNSAAASMASTLASYGENVLQTTLGGRREICKKTNFIVLVVVVIIAIIVTYLCWGSCAVGVWGVVGEAVGATIIALAAVAMAVAALIINVTVTEPGLTRLWNKMQGNLPLPDQVIEDALLTGIRAVITDSKRLLDHFDYDVDGLWVDSTGNTNGLISSGNPAIRYHKELLSRFGYYYTRRLMDYAPAGYPEIEDFKTGLTELLYDNPYSKVGPPPTGCTAAELTAGDIRCQNADYFGIVDPGCPSPAPGNLPNPYCDPCCLPEFQEDGVSPLRPVECTPAQAAACGAGDYPIVPYQWQYDPFYENYTNSFYSLREQLGVDDENATYQRNQTNPNSPPPQTNVGSAFREEDSTGYLTAARQMYLGIVGGTPDLRHGVLPFFWDMSKLLPAQQTAIVTVPPTPILPKTDSVIMMTADPLNCTPSPGGCPNNFVVDPGLCAVTVGFDGGTNRPKTDGFYWKPGADEYCSNVFPYNDCINYVGNCATGYYGGAIPDCGCPASDDPTLWHDDNLDVMIYGLKQFTAVAQDLLQKDSESLGKDFLTWFPTIAEWISPQCGVTPNSWCYDGPNDGVLLVWRDMVGSWVDLIDTWLYQTSFADDTNWCLPTAANANATFLYNEKRIIPSLGTFTTVSTDTLTIANGGTIVLNVGIHLSYATGESVLISFDANNYMIGTVALYNQATGSLTVNLNSSVGYGSYSNWNVDRIMKDKDGTDIPTIWGDLNDVVACMNYNMNNNARIAACQTACATNPTDYTGNADACLNLPRSVVLNWPHVVDATKNTAYDTAQQLEDCLISPCSDSLGGTLPVCAGLPVAQPVDCTAFGPGNAFYDAVKAERDHQFDLSDYCEPPTSVGFQLQLTSALNAANVHDPIIDARSAELTFLREGAINARNAFLSFYKNLNIFLTPCNGQTALGVGCNDCADGGPAAKLICANQRAFGAKNGLANIIIYGWQSKAVSGRGPTGTDPDKGYWHIARAEAFAPQRCYDRCVSNRLPWVKTRTYSRGLNRIRCYTLTDTDGRVIARVTRWDEDHDSPGARLANGQLLWKFRYTNPGAIPDPLMGSINSLTTDCRHPATWDAGMAPESVIALEGAFMINNNPIEDPNVDGNCFRTVQGLLNLGVQSTTCARYYFDDAINHMNLKFTPCVQADVDYVTSCVASGLCP